MDLPKLSGQRRTLLAKATAEYSSRLEGSPAEEYLVSRGIPVEIAVRFKLGYVAEPVDGHESRFQGKLSIPYLTPTGPVGMRFRRLDGKSEFKYDSEEGQRTQLFNVLDLHKSDPWIAVCEGELDTVVMSGVVGVPAIGLPGVEHWQMKANIWSKLLQDYETVFLALDPDEAGKKFIPMIARSVENAVVVELPGDVNETVNEYGPDWVLQQMGLGDA